MHRLAGFLHTSRLGPRAWALIGAAALALLATLVLATFAISIPLPDKAPGAQATRVFSHDGKLIGTLRGAENRTIVPLSAVSPHLARAVVATEDRDFYEHSGISFRGMFRALFTNVKAGGVTQGGSTITQQYARNAFDEVGRERSIVRKLKEIALSRKIERKFEKDKILEFYLNTVYFGRGAYGAEAAAQAYFKKHAKDLTLGEAAYLAGVIRAPHRFQVDEKPESAVAIRNEVLSDMRAAGMLPAAEATRAQAQDLAGRFKLGPTLNLESAKAGYFLEYIRRLLMTDEYGFSESQVLGGGLQITTTLDLEMQAAAEKAISSTLDRPDDPEAALIAMDTEGRVKAMVGGRDVADPRRARGYNYSANLRPGDTGGRFAGSAFKPFTLAALVEEGKSVKSRFPAPAQLTLDSARCRNQDGTPWEVSNFGNRGFGTVDVLQGPVNSVNTFYAQLMDKMVTPAKFRSVAQRLGVPIPSSDTGCALTLGTSAVTPMEMARAFTTFAARGKRPEPLIITRIASPEGKVLKEQEPETEQVLDPNVADTVNYVLKDVINRGTATAAKIGRPAAGKTGTTQKNVDAWFAGYTPAMTAVVWMGYPPDEAGNIPEMNSVRGREVTGGSFPAAIWRKFMSAAVREYRVTDFVKPKLAGEVVNPAPKLCPEAAPVEPGQPAPPQPSGCKPRPAPSPVQTAVEVPAPEITYQPGPVQTVPAYRPPVNQQPVSPPPSPSPSPSPGPSLSPQALAEQKKPD